jgi:epoxyqueuosine reductase
VLDARRCISYHTIENKGSIPADLRPHFGNRVFGCDDCQTVCPFQRFAPATAEAVFAPGTVERAAPPLADLLMLDAAGFAQRFAGSPVLRIKRERLVRNACVAAGNSRDPRLIPLLAALLDDAAPLIRAHAAWALWQLAGPDSRPRLQRLRAAETSPDVLAELAALPV